MFYLRLSNSLAFCWHASLFFPPQNIWAPLATGLGYLSKTWPFAANLYLHIHHGHGKSGWIIFWRKISVAECNGSHRHHLQHRQPHLANCHGAFQSALLLAISRKDIYKHEVFEQSTNIARKPSHVLIFDESQVTTYGK